MNLCKTYALVHVILLPGKHDVVLKFPIDVTLQLEVSNRDTAVEPHCFPYRLCDGLNSVQKPDDFSLRDAIKGGGGKVFLDWKASEDFIVGHLGSFLYLFGKDNHAFNLKVVSVEEEKSR